MNSTLILVAVVLGIGIIGYGVYLLRRAEEDPLTARIDEFAAREELASLEDIELTLSLSDRVFVPLLRRLSDFVVRLTPQKTLEQTARQLELAGNPYNMSAAHFWIMRGSFTILFAGLVFMMLARFGSDKTVVYSLGAGVLGYMLPAMLIRSISDRRKESILKKLPDALDLMTICVDAGATFNGAMQKVGEKWDDPLSKEFERAIYEMQLGKTRRQSLKDMSDRMEVRDVTSFIAAVLQADQLGVGIGKVLRIQSEQMRIRRRQRAEEKAQQAPVKMLFPMVFLIFPSIFIVLLGPAGFQVLRNPALQGLNG